MDQLIIGDVHSYDDFEASVAERRNIKPKKKIIKETVPFSNITHDFSAINGEIYWEERTLEYVFEITAESAEELEAKKQPFMSWIMNVANAELHDPFIEDYHFLATFDEIDDDDSEIEKSTITVRFKAYPYMISNEEQVWEFPVAFGPQTVEVFNNSSHRIIPTIYADVKSTIYGDKASVSIPVGEITDERFMLYPGVNSLKIGTSAWTDDGVTDTEATGTIWIKFYEEVF